MNRFSLLIVGTILLGSLSCKKNHTLPPINNDVDLDGSKINDSSLLIPANYLLSAAIPNPTASDLAKPVVITAHGFSATNYEWTEFRDWAKVQNDFNVSLVLLGGHGRDYQDFKSSTWEEWQAPIIEEYNKLVKLGYQNISIVGSSTGCPLVLEMIHSGKIQAGGVLKHVFFIDPIIIPSNKILSLAPAVGPFVGYLTTDLAAGENGYWYKYRPQHALRQLEELIRHERKKLEKGITLPEGVSMQVFKAEKDDAADPASAVVLKKGIKLSNGNAIIVNMISSNLHVFTRLHGRAKITAEDYAFQLQTFEKIRTAVKL